jgi:hypothetical protein
MNSKLYAMSFPEEDEDYEPFGVAYINPTDSDVSLPENGQQVHKWKVINFDLRMGGFADYLANDLGGRLCSEQLKNIIEANKSLNDSIAWLEAEVANATDRRTYWFLYFPINADVLNHKMTKFVGSLIIKPAFDQSRTQKYNIFGLPEVKGYDIFVSSTMKTAIESAHLTGLSFSERKY